MPNDIFEQDDDHVILPPAFFDNLWQPDPYFLNSKISGYNFFIYYKYLLLLIEFEIAKIQIIQCLLIVKNRIQK